MSRGETLQSDGELDIARSHDVLNFEVGKLGVESELLNDSRVFSRRQLGIILRLGPGDDHLPRGEDQRRRLGLANPHDHGRETLHW